MNWRGRPFRYAQRQHAHPSKDWTGLCLQFVRSCYGVPAAYPSAAAAWRSAKHRHPTEDPATIPRGVPVFWTGGSHGYGHVAVSRGGGSCWTTDLMRPGRVDVAPIELVARRWSLELAGWAEDINGARVWHPDESEDDDMPYSEDELTRIIQRAIRTMPIAMWGPDHNPQHKQTMAKQLKQARGFAADAYRESRRTRRLVRKLLDRPR